MPPNNACEDDDGRPFHQVSRFTRGADEGRTDDDQADDARWRSMMPLPTVSATLVPMKAPKRLKSQP